MRTDETSVRAPLVEQDHHGHGPMSNCAAHVTTASARRQVSACDDRESHPRMVLDARALRFSTSFERLLMPSNGGAPRALELRASFAWRSEMDTRRPRDVWSAALDPRSWRSFAERSRGARGRVPVDTTAHAPPPKAPRGRTVAFAASIMALIAASAFTGAALAPHLGGGRAPDLRDPGELAVFLEHAQVDVRLGRGAPLARSLEKIAKVVTDPSVKDRVLALWADAAMQSGSLADAALAEEQREALAADPAARDAVRLVRVGLLAG